MQTWIRIGGHSTLKSSCLYLEALCAWRIPDQKDWRVCFLCAHLKSSVNVSVIKWLMITRVQRSPDKVLCFVPEGQEAIPGVHPWSHSGSPEIFLPTSVEHEQLVPGQNDPKVPWKVVMLGAAEKGKITSKNQCQSALGGHCFLTAVPVISYSQCMWLSVSSHRLLTPPKRCPNPNLPYLEPSQGLQESDPSLIYLPAPGRPPVGASKPWDLWQHLCIPFLLAAAPGSSGRWEWQALLCSSRGYFLGLAIVI